MLRRPADPELPARLRQTAVFSGIRCEFVEGKRKRLGFIRAERDVGAFDRHAIVRRIMRKQFGLQQDPQIEVTVIIAGEQALNPRQRGQSSIELLLKGGKRVARLDGLAGNGLYERQQIARAMLKFGEQHLLSLLKAT